MATVERMLSQPDCNLAPHSHRTRRRFDTNSDATTRASRQIMAQHVGTQAIHATFVRRGTHAEPVELEPPPEEWRAAFAQLAAEIGLRATTVDATYAEVAAFWKTLME